MAIAGELKSSNIAFTVTPSFHKRIIEVCVKNNISISDFMRNVAENAIIKIEAKK